MKEIVLEKEKIHCGTLVLVNQHYPMKERKAENLVPFDMHHPQILLEKDAASALQLLLKEISAQNDIVPVSGYRSKAEQTAVYEDSLKESGEAFTKKYVALPGCSEHQTGLAIDLGLNQDQIDFICPDFPYEGICDVFRKAAPEYGFIERYAGDKEEITGISQEPWHFRYTGYPHSAVMTEEGMALEEYMEFLKDYRDGDRLVYRNADGSRAEIFYVPVLGGEAKVELQETEKYQISGNNIDGFVVTVLWKVQAGYAGNYQGTVPKYRK